MVFSYRKLKYWTSRGKLDDGWFCKSASEMEEETGLTRNEQETARKKLKALGILSERLAGVPATLHFKINFDALESALQTEEKSGAGGIYHHIAVTDIQHKEEQ